MKSWDNEHESLWTDEEQAYWLAYDQLSVGLGVRIAIQFSERLGSMKAIWHAPAQELKAILKHNFEAIDKFVMQRAKVDPEDVLKELKKTGVQAYPYYHPLYPASLRQIHDPPTVLYMLGSLHPDDLRYSVGVVGTRRPTTYGQRLAKDLARGLSESGVTIISGMAVGIDSLSHWGAIDGGGKTVAVLACGPDICYPSSNKPLHKLLTQGNRGAVVSEFFPGTKPEKWRFPARNRVISGLSSAVLVVEAGLSSGALITARLAFDQGRDVFAVPGRLDNPMSAGTNKLIANNVAKLITGWECILDEKRWVTLPQMATVPTVVELYGRERELFEMISGEPVHFDYLCQKSEMSSGELSATLTMLELAGIIERLPGDWYSRQRSSSVV